MDISWLSRTALIVGNEVLEKLTQSKVLIVGMGGVGSFAAEFIVRAGIGNVTIVDGDVVEPSNRNRQLPALATTEGQYKVEVMKERLLAINPELNITAINHFMTPDDMKSLLSSQSFDYAVDAIDSISPKIQMLVLCYQTGTRVVSSMGAGGKLDPTQLKIVDISQTHTCKLARYVRKRLKKYKIYTGIKAVFSTEKVIAHSLMYTQSRFKKSAYGTISYLPAAFGGACASVVIRDLIEQYGKQGK
ncbi:MAG: tRNA threonylcarbamoyladenosine dehydratase [Bacteroidia bacterium]|nr:tRNA threonylcarbamoyladenosine dehydratase [Bacteroidia bacterium]